MPKNIFNFFLGSDQPGCPRKKSRCWLNYRIGLVQRKKKSMLQISLTNEQKVKVTLAPVTDSKKPAPLDGKPTWSVTSGEVELEPSEDGLSCDIISADTPGDSEILIQADANLGEEIETISEVLQVHVSGALAKNLGVTIGTPEDK